MSRTAKKKGPGDLISIRLNNYDTQQLIEWFNLQKDISKAVKRIIQNDIMTNGLRDVMDEYVREDVAVQARPQRIVTPTNTSVLSNQNEKSSSEEHQTTSGIVDEQNIKKLETESLKEVLEAEKDVVKAIEPGTETNTPKEKETENKENRYVKIDIDSTNVFG